MKALSLTAPRRIAARDVPGPAVSGPYDVRVKIARVGVCGSDVHYFTEGGIGSQRVEYPWTVGHEGSGIVTEVGAAVTRVRPGDRIAFDPAQPCGVCDQCRADRAHTCRAQAFLGCPGQTEGCLSEFLVLPERSCYPIPDGMSLEEAALVEPLSIGIYAVTLAGPISGATLGILGAGPIGLSVLMAARAHKAGRVVMTEPIPARRVLAARLGADWVGDPSEEAEIVRREPALLDAVFECTGEQDAMDQAVRLLKPGGTLLLIGIPGGQNRVSFDINLLRRKELRLQNVRRQNHCVQPAIDLIASHRVNAAAMVTHRFPFDATHAAFDLAAGYGDGVVKAMIVVDDHVD